MAEENTIAADAVEASSQNDPSLDKWVKVLLQAKDIQALVLKAACPDLFMGTVQEIAGNLRKSIGTEGSRDHLTDREKDNPQLGKVVFDALVLCMTGSQDNDTILVDTEVEHLAPTKGKIPRFCGRDLAYHARLFMEQKNDQSGYLQDRYEDMKPVVTIWIMPDARKSDVQSYQLMNKAHSFGHYPEMAQYFERMYRTVIIHAGPDWETCGMDAVECIANLFRTEKSYKSKKDYLEEKGVDMSVKTTNEALEQVDNKVRWYLQSDAEKYEKQLAEKLAEKEKEYADQLAQELADKDREHAEELADKDRELVERDRENDALRQENEELKKLLSQQPMWIHENGTDK